MAKRPSKHLRPPRPLSTSFARSEAKRDGTWLIQSMPAGRSVKDYLCPGCHQSIPAGAPHLVAWPSVAPIGASSGVDHRRHWHSACWARRA
ncbi:hypothetical protein G7070_15015 [Propioniciclava coleopterorum]|uniref:ATP/GTP-binding protein n=1 Tax=Propioniciclava coleopterorum TaxID=2714937 RepID=A0A6G7Y962_9ACTN|nr:hypothetical protein [Propioniciclava coleopterorum]QIK73333.1 hypothetical protein G7070_15015 [Propioniciclava coleopterorum]